MLQKQDPSLGHLIATLLNRRQDIEKLSRILYIDIMANFLATIRNNVNLGSKIAKNKNLNF